MKRFFLIGIVIIFFLSLIAVAQADLDSDINQLNKDIEALKNELSGKQANYQKLNTQLQNIKTIFVYLYNEIVKKQKEVTQGEEVLDYQKKLLNERARVYYKNIGKNTISLLNLLVAGNLSQSLDNFFYQKTIVDEDRKTIIKIVLYIKNLEEKKKTLEEEKIQLAALKIEVDKQSEILVGEISETKQKIATLTSQQQSLIAQKQASLNLPKSAYTSQGGCSSDLTNGKNPGFSPAFGFFTFGVPHRVGLNQYGAKGRADNGQNAKQILEAYYNAEYKEGYGQDINIHVVGTNEYGQNLDNSWNIDEYLKHVYEMPTNWSMEALKAQAIAARSYALAYTNNGEKTICPNQGCQVVKQEENTDAWKQAVDQTKGVVLLNGGNPISAYFSSTAGGYTYSSSNDISSRPWTKNTQDGRSSYNNFDDIKNNAYDKESNWFYCDWGSRSQYDGTAWLTSEELADIINVIHLVQESPSYGCFVYQIDKSPPTPNPNEGCSQTNNWSFDKVKGELKKQKAFNSINSILVSADFGSGKTTRVTGTGDAGSFDFDATEFKNWFNLRAPANIQIVGPLFNIEKR